MEADTKLLVYNPNHAPLILPEPCTEYDKKVILRSRYRRRYAVDMTGTQMLAKLNEYSSLKHMMCSQYFVDEAL